MNVKTKPIQSMTRLTSYSDKDLKIEGVQTWIVITNQLDSTLSKLHKN